jgi:hypothetical protein
VSDLSCVCERRTSEENAPCGNPLASSPRLPLARETTVWRSDIRNWERRRAHIKGVDTPVELLDSDVLHGATPTDAIEDHLLCLGRIVPTGLQEAPVQGTVKRDVKRDEVDGIV